jgi:two-component system cell cycle sensor histidine kinase/response regulator CckA
LDSQLGLVKADPGQVEQVIMNLAVNARDAMPQGGNLTIETTNVNLDAHYSRRHREAHPGSYVMLAVSDTGVGMDKETQRRIFEPFFTTKEVGKGTGLGLSTIYGIIKQSNGHIWVYSEPGHGTTFKIYLPRIQKNSGPAQASSTDEKPIRGTETILVVEDEDTIRELAEEILQTCGYMVLTAHNGQEALTICEDHCGAIDLLLTDVIMPRMNGRDLAERLIRRWPKIKVLYVSGYTDDFVVHRGELDEGTAFLQKPFSAKTLTEKIRCILDLGNRPVPEHR